MTFLVDGSIALGRVKTVRNLNGVLIVRRRGGACPALLDAGVNGAAIEAVIELQVGSRVLVVATGGVERSSLRVVEVSGLELVGRLPLADRIASLLGNPVVNIGTDIPSAKSGEIPVGRDGSNLGVVVVEVVVGGANQLLGKGIAKQDAKDLVVLGVGLVLVKGQKDKGVVHEVGVLKEGFEEVTDPAASSSNVGVVTVRGHVGSNKHPLRKLVVLEVLVEHGARLVNHGQVLVLRDVLLKMGDAVSEHSRVVLADVVIAASLLVLVSHALESGKGHVFLVVAPRDASVQEKVVNSRDVVWQAKEVVILHAKVVTSDSSHVVGL